MSIKMKDFVISIERLKRHLVNSNKWFPEKNKIFDLKRIELMNIYEHMVAHSSSSKKDNKWNYITLSDEANC